MTHRQNALAINAIDTSPVLWVAEEDDGGDCEDLEVSIRMSIKALESRKQFQNFVSRWDQMKDEIECDLLLPVVFAGNSDVARCTSWAPWEYPDSVSSVLGHSARVEFTRAALGFLADEEYWTRKGNTTSS